MVRPGAEPSSERGPEQCQRNAPHDCRDQGIEHPPGDGAREERSQQTRAETQTREPTHTRGPDAREECRPQRGRLLYTHRPYAEHRIEIDVGIEEGYGKRLQQDAARRVQATGGSGRERLARAGAARRAESVAAEKACAGDGEGFERQWAAASDSDRPPTPTAVSTTSMRMHRATTSAT